MRDGSEPESPAAWLAAAEARIDEQEAAWAAGFDAVHEDDLGILGHRPFRVGFELDGQWTEVTVTLAALIASPLAEAIMGPVGGTTIADAIRRLAGKGVLIWDQEAQTATFGPRMLQAWSAEAAGSYRRASAGPGADLATPAVPDRNRNAR